MATVRLNVVANFVGRIWTTALGFLFIPVYLKCLGIEAYGLVGFFSTLQAVFGLLDLGLSATINREMARLSVGNSRGEQRDLLRTLELVYWGVSLSLGLGVLVLAPAIATRWVHPEHLSAVSVTRAVRLMGIVIAMQFPWGFYQGGLFGLQRQVFLNTAVVITGTLRSAGAALVVWRVSPTVEAFFLWQALVSIVQTSWLALATWRAVPGPTAPRFRPAVLRAVWVFAATVAANALIGTVLTQLDKVLLSRLLTLEEFGYYALAGAAGSIVWLAILPVNQALFPRFVELVQTDDTRLLATVYHRASQTINVLIVPMSATVAFFSYELIAAWTRSATTAAHTSLIVKILIVGTSLNGLASLAGQLQNAAGWPQLVMYTNLAAAVVLVPLLLYATSHYGAPGAAAVWVILNSSYLLVTIPIMHRRILRGELRQWYWNDLLLPAATAIVVIATAHAITPVGLFGLPAVLYAGASWLVALMASALVAPLVRTTVVQIVFGWRTPAAVWR
jgi:O-antigen/teichoic acid export membrane protein